jgi:uncharacterized surface protein with fasciclin (FAS1) repeats
MKHYHYYINGDWSITKRNEPIIEDSADDMTVRYQLTLEEVAEYLLDPWKFASDNGINDERYPADPDDDEAYYEAWGKEISSEDTLKGEDMEWSPYTRCSKFDEPDIPVLSDDSWCWYPLQDGTWSNINHDITFESWAELHEADLWERLQVPRYIRTELRTTAGLGEMLSRTLVFGFGKLMELTDSQQNENLIEYLTYHLIEGDTTGEELYSVNMQAFVHEYCWASDPEMGNCIVLSDACRPEYNNLVDAINAYIDWHKFSKEIHKED